MKYTVFFEVYGKKLKANITADSPQDAEYRILGKVKFHKVALVDEPFADDEVLGFFDDIFGGFK